ncbi:M23 family metallopeptidase [Bacillaceae bacterium SIJ1]|uniref:M23 family metallopeptidase n=1 Tax=Litoribacterium kuwaitense TaxID=1398745 RepID=UPI0013EACDE8|nr:M23 family metallopeptidase [Litoribacterium kuwaitense]NGP45484.1 M23 family metallopeptidase [Litoribacterium kuwaitense]
MRRADQVRKSIRQKMKRQQMKATTYEHKDLPDKEPVKQSTASTHPLFRLDTFLTKMLLAALLFLLSVVIVQRDDPLMDEPKRFLSTVMTENYSFAAVEEWYSAHFGEPFAWLPFTKESTQPLASEDQTIEDIPQGPADNLALPASGQVAKPFSQDHRGVVIETGPNTEVKSIDYGYVIFAGTKDELGKTVIVQHSDDTETWYGNLDEVSVQLYDFIDDRQVVGAVKGTETSAQYYFAKKYKESFVNPLEGTFD